jgi:hypothetical protein
MPRKGERMLTRIQLKASGPTAHEVESQLRESINAITQALGLQGSITDQYIEGTPGKSFDGRLVYTVKLHSNVTASGWPARAGVEVGTNG